MGKRPRKGRFPHGEVAHDDSHGFDDGAVVRAVSAAGAGVGYSARGGTASGGTHTGFPRRMGVGSSRGGVRRAKCTRKAGGATVRCPRRGRRAWRNSCLPRRSGCRVPSRNWNGRPARPRRSIPAGRSGHWFPMTSGCGIGCTEPMPANAWRLRCPRITAGSAGSAGTGRKRSGRAVIRRAGSDRSKRSMPGGALPASVKTAAMYG